MNFQIEPPPGRTLFAKLAYGSLACALFGIIGPAIYVYGAAGSRVDAATLEGGTVGILFGLTAMALGGYSLWRLGDEEDKRGTNFATAGCLVSLITLIIWAVALSLRGGDTEGWYLDPLFVRGLGLAGSYTLVTTVCFLMLAAWMASVFFSDTTPRRRVVLGVLRLLVIVVLALAMLRPTRVFTEMKPQVASLIFLFDQSRSMTVADGFGGMTRWKALTQALDDAEPTLERLSDKFEVRPYGFDANANLLASEEGLIELPAEPLGDQSAYGAALAEVLRQEDGKRLTGVILLGDGAEQTFGAARQLPQSAARQLAQLGVPLYTAAFGQRIGQQQARDVALETMTDNPTVFVKNELAITGSVRINGYVGQDIPVQLRYEVEPGKMEVVDTQVLRAVQDNDQLEFSLKHIPQTPGEFKVEVVAVPQDGEVTVTNNQLPTYVTVLPGGLRVLYVEGELRREQRFLRRALDSSPDIDVDFQWINKKTKPQWPVKFRDDPFASGKYNVIILGDVDSDALGEENLEAIADAVRRGAGLIMLGGYQSFRPGGYQFTPLRAVLPVEMDPVADRHVRQSIGGTISPDLHLEGPISMQPTPLGLRHYIMNLNPGEPTAEAWADLPPLSGANKFRAVKPGAAVLAETPRNAPLLVAGDVGGRTLAFAGDSTWRWVMQGDDKAHQRFWRQVILWLARKEEIAKGNVWVQLESRRFAPGAPVNFTAGAMNDQREPVLDAEFRAEVVKGDTRERVRLARQGDLMRGTFFAGLEPGDYTLAVTAEKNGAPLGPAAEARFMVYEKDLEMSNSAANPALLASLSGITAEAGGRRIAPEELPDLLEELAAKPLEMEVEEQTKVTYWDRWYVFLFVVGLLTAEWFFRKRWRMV